MSRVRDYFRGLSAELGGAWNRFWFHPSDPFDLCVMRIVFGALALLWQLSYTADLIRWFGRLGWFDAGVIDKWITAESAGSFNGRLSFLFNDTTSVLWTMHGLSSLVLLAFTLGVFTRVTSVLSFAVVLAYIHRAPFVCSATEVVLSMLIGYLCLAPCGQALSWDARRRPATTPRDSVWATLARRLLQVHLVAIYLVMALSKLGAPTWWNGEAVWWLAAQPLSRDVNLLALRDLPLVLNLWTYGILIVEFSFVLFVWNLWLRPLVLAAATASWISLALASGNFALPITMIVAHLVFVPSWFWKESIARPAAAPGRSGT
jgi:hypothetical protein